MIKNLIMPPFKLRNAIYALILLAIGCKTAKTPEPVIFSVGDTHISTKEFLYVYNKNNFRDKKEDSIKALKEYLDLFVNFKLKVKEAENLGMDTTESFRSEFEGYRKQLAQPYLADKSLNDKMMLEAYDRLKTEINASHILIGLTPSASPSDTLKAYQEIEGIRKKALAGEDFDMLARTYSHDSSARYNYGNLGYFTSMQMVYPFETAAYSTSKGQVSTPVRTQYGYHILKVNDVRSSQGSVLVTHIMIKTNQEMPPEELTKAKEKSLKIYDQLQKGAKWSDLVRQFSEDFNSKENDGKLDWFSVGGIIPSFENAAFALKNPGDISQPVQTPFGWHIIKLLERKPVDSYEKMQSQIKSRVNKDSRSSINKDLFVNKLKKEYNFKENQEGVKSAQALVDTLTSKHKLPIQEDASKNKVLFTLNNKNFTVDKFYDYLQAQRPANPNEPPVSYYKDFVNETVLNYEESRLSDKYEDYKMLVKEYREGILLFSLMDENVWSKAVKDSVGLKSYYDKNKASYMSQEMADAIILSFADSMDLVKTMDSLKAKGSIEKTDWKALETTLNAKNPLRFQAVRDSVEKKSEPAFEIIPWKTGEFNAKINGRYHYVKILSIFKPENQEFEDVRGQVISDYQKYLEDEWIKNLKSKYPVQINQKELKKLGITN